MVKIFPLIASLVSLPLILAWLLAGTSVNWEELALGKETFSPHVLLQDGTRVYAKDGDRAIHCESLVNCFEKYDRNGRTVLWLGNSQLHAINQFKETDRLASEILYHQLGEDGVDLLTVSHPSANLQEHYVISEYAKARLNLNAVVVGIVFDDMREFGVRNDVANVLGDSKVFSALNETFIGKKILKRSQEVLDIEDEYGGLNKTQQDETEQILNRELTKVSDTWGRRPYLRGLVFNAMYKTRNYVFDITPSTKRKVIRPRYVDNWSALEQLIESYSSSGIQVYLYVAPIRDDVEVPYVLDEYEKFKREVESLALRKNVDFRNFETIVPAEFWGVKDSTALDGGPELDFMHYQYGGHKILSSAVYEMLQLREDL